MERLTYDFCIGGNHCWQIKGADNLECREVCRQQEENGCKDCPIAKAFDRLAAYEDTGLEPEDIKQAFTEETALKLAGQSLGITPDRLRALAGADREGRCFVFRFGFGETVYRIWVHPSGKPAFVTENRMDTLNDLLNAETWNNAYKTRAEAEAALRREQE